MQTCCVLGMWTQKTEDDRAIALKVGHREENLKE